MVLHGAVLLLVQAAAPPHDGTPGPRAAVAGLAGFQSISRIDFGAQQNRLTAVYVFPDRARWHFENYGAHSSQRLNIYRHGEEVHQFSTGSASEEMKGEARDIVLLQMELRRAAMLWPDGFEWQAGADGARAAVQAHSCCRTNPIGSVVASALEQDRPGTFEARTADGRLIESIEVSERQEIRGRSWPRKMAVRSESGEFVETVESIETDVYFLDLSFLPCDRRPLSRSAGEGPQIISSDLISITFQTRAVAESSTWEEAVLQARAWITELGEALRQKGLLVDPVPTFELSPEGRPLRCMVRIEEHLTPPPAGFETLAERPGLLLAVPDLSRVDRALLSQLAACAPEGTRPGVPYLRIHEGKPGRIEVVLPLEPPE